MSTIRLWLAPLLLASTVAGGSGALGQHDHEDYVPDEKTAIAIAEAVARGQIAGDISRILPFKAVLDGEVWRVWSRLGLGRKAKGYVWKGVFMDIKRNTGEIVRYGYYPFD